MSAAESIVVLDTRSLGLVSNPKTTPDNDACRQWLDTLVAQGRRVLVPDIADYKRGAICCGRAMPTASCAWSA